MTRASMRHVTSAVLLGTALLLAGCNSASTSIGGKKNIPLKTTLGENGEQTTGAKDTSASETTQKRTDLPLKNVGSALGVPVNGSGGYYKVGATYRILGVEYYPEVDYDHVETGIASWYGPNFHGKLTANGEIFDQELITAAHRTLPMPSFAVVT
ncbi:MAG: hypothetical protein K0U36_01500, partial [Alphaproteobacteria bacterium]|nr:hypothetical protein [Alphaproteobacteria bacterium]